MLFNHKYNNSSSVNSSSKGTSMNFVPDVLRDPTFFVGKLNKKIAFREAISALHDVVVSDLRYKSKDKTEYKEWVADQEKLWLGEYMSGFQIESIRERIEQLREELENIYKEKYKIMGPFNKAKKNILIICIRMTRMHGLFLIRLLPLTLMNYFSNVSVRMNLLTEN